MTLYIILTILSITIAVNGVPVDMNDEEGNTTEVNVPYHHMSKYGPRFTPEQIKGSIACTEQKTIYFTSEWIKMAYECVDPEIWGSEEGKRDLNCKFFCQGYSTGILDENGLPSKSRYDTYVDLAVPEEQRLKAKEVVHECLQTMLDKIDVNDPKCGGAGEFNKCIFRVFEIEC